MTNGDKIREMNNKQLAQMMAMACPPENGQSRLACTRKSSCACCWLEWLNKEAEK